MTPARASRAAASNDSDSLAPRLARLFALAGLLEEREWRAHQSKFRRKNIVEVLGQDVSLGTFRDFLFRAEINPFKFSGEEPAPAARLTDSAEIAYDELARMLVFHKTPIEWVARTLEEAKSVEPGVIQTGAEQAAQLREEVYPWLVRQNLISPGVIQKYLVSPENQLARVCALHMALSILAANGIVKPAELDELTPRLLATPHAEALAEARKIVPATSSELLGRIEAGLKLPQMDIAAAEIEPPLLELFPAQFIRRHLFLPFKVDASRVSVAIDDPLDIGFATLLRWITGKFLEPWFSPSGPLVDKINACYGPAFGAAPSSPAPPSPPAAPEAAKEPARGKGEKARAAEAKAAAKVSAKVDAVRASAGPADTLSAVQMVSSLIESAVELKATDIHIEPARVGLAVRFRIDGSLTRILTIPPSLVGSVISRVKVLANLDVTERRRPQDGHIALAMGERRFDFRVATLPAGGGEKVAIRILDSARVMTGLKDTGMSADQLAAAERLIRLPYGVVLVTGPTGSGKTSTLYAALNALNEERRQIVTIEDPIEYQLEGINQVQVDPTAGLDFSEGLRAILRQDPDVIMVGEIRDPDTALTAVRAAMTGHLVFSTLHTNTALGAFQALHNMSATPYMIGSAVGGVIAQRLVRRLCPECKRPEAATKALAQQLGLRWSAKLKLHRAVGCASCLETGYAGRVGLFEVLEMTDKLRRAVLNNDSPAKLGDAAKGTGRLSLREAGVEKVKAGITSPEELIEKAMLD